MRRYSLLRSKPISSAPSSRFNETTVLIILPYPSSAHLQVRFSLNIPLPPPTTPLAPPNPLLSIKCTSG
ncbi:hypothetical protein K440DRAFT_631415 [Wilcoxina mikolae CBS 423.85]|nr:hypothetical protein K440DRAFT_631415 [Wilcoxina mikolae CBS 423.85]